jgi:hypothetical protein
MKITQQTLTLLLIFLASSHLAMARHGEYDEEAQAEERIEKELNKKEGRHNPVKAVAEGVKTATVDSTTDLVSGAREAADTKSPVTGTLEGARVGSAKAVQTAAKGVFEVATLGYADTEKMKVQQPKKDSEDVTKFSVGF